MSKALDKLTKLKGRSFAELRERAAQKCAAYAEKLGWAEHAQLPTDEALQSLMDASVVGQNDFSHENLLEHFRQRTAPKFFAAFDDRAEAQKDLHSHFGPREQQALIEKADKIIAGRFQLLGLSNLNFGEPIDWHLEPVSQKRSPLIHWSRIDELETGATGDKKIVWELNRHQHFVTLGRAYWLTGDELYAQTFATHLAHWMNENPPKLGLNWLSSLEVAFRAINWLWALNFFKASAHLQPALFSRALKYLYLHARHLEKYLSTYASPNTHLTGEALGLFYLGTLLPEFRRAARWRETGRSILCEELERHVLEDGVYFERTSYYHRYTTDFYTHFLLLSERNGAEIPRKLKTKLQSLLDHLMHLTRPDGTTPFIGDDDGGRLSMLDERAANDFRATLSTGAAIFNRADYKYVAREAAEETFWLTGRAGLEKFAQLASQTPSELSRAFPAGGYYIMRDGWASDANYLLIDGGPHGALGCGHAHADALAFDLSARGRTLLVDTGTYTYTGSSELRDSFRHSAAHNTLTIDGESSSIPDGPFSWKFWANASVISWQSHARFDYFAGAHDGYMRLSPAPARHTRSVLFLKNDYWVIRDSVLTEGEHRYDLHFHFAAGAHPLIDESEDTHSLNEPSSSVPGLQIFSFADGGEWKMEDGWISSAYGSRERATVCRFSKTATGAQEFFSFLLPRRAESAQAIVHEREAVGGRSFELRDDAQRDLLLVADGELVETEFISTNFKWCWARFGVEAEMPDELVLLDGSSLRLSGQEILSLPERVACAVARRVGDKFQIEIEDRILEVDAEARELVTASLIANLKSKI
jgi:hypothetical protein